MATHVSGAGREQGRAAAVSPWVTGWTAAAAVLMVFGGIMAIFAGIAAIANDPVFVVNDDFVYAFNLTGWGWVHLLLGVVIAIAGVALFTGAPWARAVGVVLAGLSMIANFLWLPYAPVWSIVLIVVDGFIIWALCSPRRESAT
ncbi:DUF7144 family membrane protein [Streptomyces himalayensis]|uniref:DUF7144 domain-containing protein n=2 Tax=Streptomyces himalayensis TaxID=2820085 RepID=A0A7W2D2I4_9ACTN|nr:hypothetical protein [Streptomyces himalayensis]MBA2947566.1 hypothetical protein [Streptomyces himalayensis subsp. himalayensis]MBA4863245.1 hypothetical protein [Streptomyces himalayensis subsp. aureolus]